VAFPAPLHVHEFAALLFDEGGQQVFEFFGVHVFLNKKVARNGRPLFAIQC
jgi:hypothetical protein